MDSLFLTTWEHWIEVMNLFVLYTKIWNWHFQKISEDLWKFCEDRPEILSTFLIINNYRRFPKIDEEDLKIFRSYINNFKCFSSLIQWLKEKICQQLLTYNSESGRYRRGWSLYNEPCHLKQNVCRYSFHQTHLKTVFHSVSSSDIVDTSTFFFHTHH